MNSPDTIQFFLENSWDLPKQQLSAFVNLVRQTSKAPLWFAKREMHTHPQANEWVPVHSTETTRQKHTKLQTEQENTRLNV